MRFRWMGFTTLLLTLTFCVVLLSSIALYLKPVGRVANWTDWRLIGLNKGQWEAVHTNAGLLAAVVAALHLWNNWKIFLNYLRQKTTGISLKRELAAASLITVALVGGTILEIPPLTVPTALNDYVKDYWEEAGPPAPTPHAEEFTLERFALSIGLTNDELQSVLAREGLIHRGTGTTIAELARQNGLSPNQIYTAITKYFPKAIRDARNKPARPENQQSRP